MSQGDLFAPWEYDSDNGGKYTLKLSNTIANAAGFQIANNYFSLLGPWPYHERDLRHVNGSTPGGKRTRIPCPSNSTPLYVIGGTYNLRGTVYTVLGAEGERRPGSHNR